jgi:hypothetical protein
LFLPCLGVGSGIFILEYRYKKIFDFTTNATPE